jgi:hypothetical protein
MHANRPYLNKLHPAMLGIENQTHGDVYELYINCFKDFSLPIHMEILKEALKIEIVNI